MEHSESTGTGFLLAGRYRLGEAIGRGGMGRVWRAHDEVLHRTVAVKELTAGRYVTESDRRVLHTRTQTEARAAARISHPGVVTVHDVLQHDDRPWIVMQYVDGPSLADALKEGGTVDAREAARIGLHVVGALRAAHTAGVLHRDVKPGNVLLARDGRVLLTDFGIAQVEGDTSITRTGELVGSIDYLAPERVQGADPGPASDLWSLGATLYTAVEGTSPFRRSSPISTMQAVVTEEPPYPEKAGPLAPVVVALLRKDPERRPGADEVERMLLDAMEGRTPLAAHAYVPTRRMTAEERAAAAPSATTPLPEPYAEPYAESRPRPYDESRPAAAAAGAPASTSPSVTAPAPAPAPAQPRARSRWRTAVLAAVVAGLLAGGAVFATMTHLAGVGADPRDDKADGTTHSASGNPGTGSGTGADPGGDQSADPSPGDGQTTADAPAGWHRVKDPVGFSILVPDGWTRQVRDGQIDYTPDNGRHHIRVSIDPSPDFENPYLHMQEVEVKLRERLPAYERVRLERNVFRDESDSCLWEFTWTERTHHPGPRRAIDQVFSGSDGTEYAIYLSAPEEDQDRMRERFERVKKSWRPPGVAVSP
ncbi:serine/threonine-protein kinase [Streptomyces sp. NPDC048717]|uniref:serine/threonine-protein kinase n=1 Tax=Streptomyces sp. NPDC048717 TaxID=3154928 RepID=UPI003419DFDD